ncbi:histidine-type phosphatase [Pseudomonas sp. ESBL9]|uniref:histidine-type phosphatase n=1 Tax=Pseudomonas sp. ESBL9 TaxID=3077327 RepID=UPI002FC81B46
MNVSLSRLARLGGPLLSVALGMSSPLTVHAQDEGHYVLEKAVQVSRHGIRPQTDTAKLVEATQRQWPTWLVRDGELTGHGYLAASLMGAWQAEQYRQAGLLPAGCPQNGTLYAVSSPKQRTRATAAALMDGMFPGCGEKPHASAQSLDPLFQTDKMDFARVDPAIAKAEILTALGGDLQAAKARLQPDLDLLKAAACVEGKPCPFYDAQWVIKQNDEGRLKIKGLDKASSLGETFRLQYSEGKPMSEVAFGHAADAKQVMALTRLHRAKYDFVNDTPHIARRGGSQLMNQLRLALEQGTPLEQADPLGNPPAAPLLVIVAHDTNLSQLRTMLGFHWTLGEYQPGNIPPTGTLAFERYRDADSGERFIRTTFVTQTPDQMRHLTPLNADNPPLHADFSLPGCKVTQVGTLCPLKDFAERLNTAIDRTALTAYRYP